MGLAPAHRTREAWNKFLSDPGPVVIASAQGAACFGAAYEFLFNVRYQLSKHHLQDKAPLSLCHGGTVRGPLRNRWLWQRAKMCEWMFSHYHISPHYNAVIQEVRADGVVLCRRTFFPSKFTMVMPRFVGIDAVRNTKGLANANGFWKSTIPISTRRTATSMRRVWRSL